MVQQINHMHACMHSCMHSVCKMLHGCVYSVCTCAMYTCTLCARMHTGHVRMAKENKLQDFQRSYKKRVSSPVRYWQSNKILAQFSIIDQFS